MVVHVDDIEDFGHNFKYQFFNLVYFQAFIAAVSLALNSSSVRPMSSQLHSPAAIFARASMKTHGFMSQLSPTLGFVVSSCIYLPQAVFSASFNSDQERMSSGI